MVLILIFLSPYLFIFWINFHFIHPRSREKEPATINTTTHPYSFLYKYIINNLHDLYNEKLKESNFTFFKPINLILTTFLICSNRCIIMFSFLVCILLFLSTHVMYITACQATLIITEARDFPLSLLIAHWNFSFQLITSLCLPQSCRISFHIPCENSHP